MMTMLIRFYRAIRNRCGECGLNMPVHNARCLPCIRLAEAKRRWLA